MPDRRNQRNGYAQNSWEAYYTIADIPGIQNSPERNPVISAQAGLNQPTNVVGIAGSPVTVPALPKKYYIGIVVDPAHTIKQLSRIGRVENVSGGLSLARKVGPPIPNLPPAGVVTAGAGANNLPFPFPTAFTAPSTYPLAQFPTPGGVVPASTTTTATATGI